MAKVILKGNEVNTNSILLAVLQNPDFTLVDSDLNDVSLSNFEGKNKILSIVPA